MISMRLQYTRLITCGALSALAGCATFGPSRTPPPIQVPAQYSVATLSPSAGVTQQIAIGAATIPEWWHAYQSPALDALVAEALADSPSLAAARASLQAAHEQARATLGSNLFPQVDAGVLADRQRQPLITFLPKGSNVNDIFAAGFRADWTIDLFGASRLTDRSVRAQVQEQALEYTATRRTLAANVVQAAIHAAALQAQIEALQHWIDFAEQRAIQTRERYQLGGASRFEMLSDAETASEAAQQLPPLRRQLLATRHAEAVLLGRNPDQAPAPLALESLRLPERLPVAVPSELLHQRPDILAAALAIRASADAAGAATVALYPSLTLSADLGRAGFDWSTLSSPAGALWGVGAALTQPVFHGGALRARQRQYQADYQAAVAQYKQTVLSAFQSVADDLVALEEDAKTLEQARRSVEALDGMQQEMAERLQSGSVPLYTVLSTREQYQDARIRYVAARAARLADSAALFDAMGTPVAAKRPTRATVSRGNSTRM